MSVSRVSVSILPSIYARKGWLAGFIAESRLEVRVFKRTTTGPKPHLKLTTDDPGSFTTGVLMFVKMLSAAGMLLFVKV